MAAILQDQLGRPLRNLRISVTDRCNLRCGYCMPEENYAWLPRQELLSFEEIAKIAKALVSLGVSKIRLTGGEPLLRKDLGQLVTQLHGIQGVKDLALTTNGLLLAEQALGLRSAGLGRLTVSLDSLNRARYESLTRRDALEQALAGIQAANSAGFRPIKINTVLLAGQNDDELFDLLSFASQAGHELRLIEYMDVGGATRWSMDQVQGAKQILARIEAAFGPLEPASKDPSAPANRYRLPDGTVFGIIASTTQPFCSNCDRARLTADGHFFTCLYGSTGLDLRSPLRAGADIAELAGLVANGWKQRKDRGAEERLAAHGRSVLATADQLLRNPHWEMHTKGG